MLILPTLNIRQKTWTKNLKSSFKYICVHRDTNIPHLQYGLEKVIHSKGVHFLQNPQTKEFNFNPELQKITQPDKVNAKFHYIPASKDLKLMEMAQQNECKYFSSTSAVSSILARIHQMIMGRRIPNLGCSPDYEVMKHTFSTFLKTPCSAMLRKRGSVYGLDSEDHSKETILSKLGKSMELFLTQPKSTFESIISSKEQVPEDGFFYGKFNSFLFRAQLDCLSSGRVFDLKSRATLPIRLDVNNYKDYLPYKLSKLLGIYESFERERYDLIRASFLKHSFQVRIGNMDGIFVCYHNTDQVFGFQYFSKEEMDRTLFGSSAVGDMSFSLCVQILQNILDVAVGSQPNASQIRLLFVFHDQTPHVYVENVLEPEGNVFSSSLIHPSLKKRKISRIYLDFDSFLNGKKTQNLHQNLSDLKSWNMNLSLTRETSKSLPFEYYIQHKNIEKFRRIMQMPRPDSDTLLEIKKIIR